MRNFFYLEGAYIVISVIILLITLFVTTRPFMSSGAKRKGLIVVTTVLVLMIGGHYYFTTERMKSVKTAFENGDPVICESRMIRKGAQSLIIKKSLGWRLEGENFVSDAYERKFFLARCIVYSRDRN